MSGCRFFFLLSFPPFWRRCCSSSHHHRFALGVRVLSARSISPPTSRRLPLETSPDVVLASSRAEENEKALGIGERKKDKKESSSSALDLSSKLLTHFNNPFPVFFFLSLPQNLYSRWPSTSPRPLPCSPGPWRTTHLARPKPPRGRSKAGKGGDGEEEEEGATAAGARTAAAALRPRVLVPPLPSLATTPPPPSPECHPLPPEPSPCF